MGERIQKRTVRAPFGVAASARAAQTVPSFPDGSLASYANGTIPSPAWPIESIGGKELAWVTFDQSARILWMNDAAAEFLLQSSRSPGRIFPFSKFVLPEDAELFLNHLRRCRSQPQNPNLTRL